MNDQAPSEPALAYVLTSSREVDRFLDLLRAPSGEAVTDEWLCVLTVNSDRPVEPRIATVLHLDWDDETAPVTRLTVLFWPGFDSPHCYLDLDLGAVTRLIEAVRACVDDRLAVSTAAPIAA